MAKNSDGTRALVWAIDPAELAADSTAFAAFTAWLIRDLSASLGLHGLRPCARCGIMLDPAFPGDAYCSQRCLDAHRAEHAATVPTTDDDPDAEFPW